MLHLTKVAVGCAAFGDLEARQAPWLMQWQGGTVFPVSTRYRPTRHAELVGGSLYWIVKHQLCARQTIIGFDGGTKGGKPCCLVMLSAEIVPVAARRKRAHQGWRYLEAARAPRDLADAGADLSGLPPTLVRELAGLGLV